MKDFETGRYIQNFDTNIKRPELNNMSRYSSSMINIFGCFKVDIDPRNMQRVNQNRNLYFFVDGNLYLDDADLVFVNKHHIRNDVFTKKIEIRNITAIQWYPYDKYQHETVGETVRYLTRGLIWRLWMEVGWFWLPGGKSTEIECKISCSDGMEHYLYFRETPENIRNITDIREQVDIKKRNLRN